MLERLYLNTAEPNKLIFFNKPIVKSNLQLLLYHQHLPVIKVLNERKCFLEAAHYVMALCFQDEFELLYIDLEGNGGLKLIRDSAKTLTPKVYDHLALIRISSICAATLYKHGTEVVKKERKIFPLDAELLDMEGCEQDYVQFKKLVRPVSRYFVIQPVQTEWNTILKAFDFFLAPGIWDAVAYLAQKMAAFSAARISHSELLETLSSQENYATVGKSIDDFLKKRYPLSKDKLKLSKTFNL